MIPADAVTAWANNHAWPTREQVEQDLLLSQAICAIANDEYLGTELIFRGGTAMHKLHVPRAWRYSEDLDYVRSTAGGIGELMQALTSLGAELGYRVGTQVRQHPKVYWKTEAQTGAPIRIKIEVNTHERTPAASSIQVPHAVVSTWWSGSAEVRTFQRPELFATKLRALYQRKKGRDLFDLWLALTVLEIEPNQIVSVFEHYRPEGYSGALAASNLRMKVTRADFRADLEPLVVNKPRGYDMDAAAELVIDQLLSKIK